MPRFERDNASLFYSVSGKPDGFPVLLIAPGGMRSSLVRWSAVVPWDPMANLDDYRVIAMDQRNAGRSTAPVTVSTDWDTYTADQLALLDHLGVTEFHVIGMCIGGPYIMGLLRHAPQRVQSAVMFQPIGLDNNRDAFFELFDGWAAELRSQHPEANEEDWVSFRKAMFGGDFLFNASREDVAACVHPILLFQGQDAYHPPSTSDAFAVLAPNVTYVEEWKAPEHEQAVDFTVKRFLRQHTPSDGR
ncbi:MAG: alpha/beta hydrolase [Myxococcota bacterium]